MVRIGALAGVRAVCRGVGPHSSRRPRPCLSLALWAAQRRGMSAGPSGAQRGTPAGSGAASAHAGEAEAAAGQTPFKPDVRPRQRGEYFSRGRDAPASVVDSMLRVDHAGEYGAVRIYDGQLAVVRDPEARRQIEEMRAQEVEHLRNLSNLVPKRRVRPTVLLPLWDVAGFALGAATAMLGPKGAMACTVAVEEAICDHYNDQLRTLHGPEHKGEDELRKLIRHNRDEEAEHRDIGIENKAEEAPFYSTLTQVIKAGCNVAIWVSKRV